MQARVYIFSVILLFLVITSKTILAQEAISDSELLERLVRIEEGQKRLESRINDLRNSNDKRFDDLQFWLQFILGVVVASLGGMIAQWMVMWKRMSQVEAKVEDRLIIGYREEEINELKRRLESLEAKIIAGT